MKNFFVHIFIFSLMRLSSATSVNNPRRTIPEVRNAQIHSYRAAMPTGYLFSYRQKVTVRHNAGRNKVMVFVGTVSEVYGGVFVIKTENGVTDRRTFSYQDMLCGDIRLRAAPENPPREAQ